MASDVINHAYILKPLKNLKGWGSGASGLVNTEIQGEVHTQREAPPLPTYLAPAPLPSGSS